MTPPLVTTFAGDSVRAEGLFVASGLPAKPYSYAYLANYYHNYVYQISLTSTGGGGLTQDNYWTNSGSAFVIAVDKLNQYVYVGSNGGVINKYTTSGSYVSQITVSGSSLNYITVDPTNTYLLGQTGIYFFKIALSSFTSVTTLSNGITSPPSYNFAVDSLGQYAYLMQSGSDTGIVKVNIPAMTYTTGSNLTFTNVGAQTIDPLGTQLYVCGTSGQSGQVAVSNTSVVEKTFSTTGYGAGCAVDATNTYFYMCNYTGNTLERVTIATGAVTTLSGFSNPQFVQVDPTGVWAYVYDYGAVLHQVNLSTFTIANSLYTGENRSGWGMTLV